MPGSWTFNRAVGPPGRFLIAATGYGPDGTNVDITSVRGVPTTINSYSVADPFGDAAASLRFPGITTLDDPDSMELRRWLRYYSDIDIYWARATPATSTTDPSELVLDPLTGEPTLTTVFAAADKVWEGYIASMAFDDEGGLEVQCQGALFQVDRYRARPFFPVRPWPIEALIAEQFDPTKRQGLRTKALKMEWPAGWQRVAPATPAGQAPNYAPVISVGAKWTAYTTRETGAWDNALTGLCQDQLSALITRPGDGTGVPVGDQWTIRKDNGRQPVMYVRNRNRPYDFAMWVGTPGLKVSLTGDSTQSENVIYGSGTDLNGADWSNSTISNDGSRTDYAPLAADPAVWPRVDNPLLVPGAFVTEVYTKFGAGFGVEDATDVAEQYLVRDREPGWTGTLSLSVDPAVTLPRWKIRAGMTVLLQGYLGTGETGIRLHISAVSASPDGGTVELTVDTRYRDLLTVNESMARTRDPLTPVRMLQVNRASAQIPDIQAPWDYSAGSGFIPLASKAFHSARPKGEAFPYPTWATSHPPISHPDWYVKCNAAATKYIDRWTAAVPIRTAERGDIARVEFQAYSGRGKLLKIPFHVSIYYLEVSGDDMPVATDGTGPSPWVNNAFESTNPSTGQPWPAGNYLAPPDSFIIGWGNRQNGVYNRAGFSPGSEADGASPTGQLVDQVAWSFDNTSNADYDPYLPNGLQTDLSITLYAIFYAEYTAPVYFMGRLYRKNPGQS